MLVPQMVLNGRSANTKTLFGSFQMVVQLIQILVWILLSGESMDPLKPFEWIWMVVQLATNTVQMVSPCVYKTNGHFWKWKFWMVSNGLSGGGLIKLNLASCTIDCPSCVKTLSKALYSKNNGCGAIHDIVWCARFQKEPVQPSWLACVHEMY